MALAASGWLALIVVAPLLPVPLAAVAYAVGSLICHQLPDRSFHIGAAQLPVCARCVGIYAGVAVTAAGGAGLLRLAGRTRQRLPHDHMSHDRDRVTALALVIGGALPTIATVLLEWGGIWRPSSVARFAAGAPLGAAVAFVVIDAVAKLHYGPWEPQRPIAPRHPPTPI